MEADQIMEDVVSKEAIRIRDDLVARHKARGESVYSLSPRAMIPYSTLKHILDKESGLSLENFIKICRGLDIDPAEYFLDDNVTAVTKEERKLLDCYRSTADPKLREIILSHAESISGVGINKK